MTSSESQTARRSNGNQVGPLLRTPLFLAWVDLALGGAAYWLAWVFRTHVRLPLTTALLPQERWQVVEHPWLILVATQLFLVYVFGLYDDLRRFRYREIFASTAMARRHAGPPRSP